MKVNTVCFLWSTLALSLHFSHGSGKDQPENLKIASIGNESIWFSLTNLKSESRYYTMDNFITEMGQQTDEVGLRQIRVSVKMDIAVFWGCLRSGTNYTFRLHRVEKKKRNRKKILVEQIFIKTGGNPPQFPVNESYLHDCHVDNYITFNLRQGKNDICILDEKFRNFFGEKFPYSQVSCPNSSFVIKESVKFYTEFHSSVFGNNKMGVIKIIRPSLLSSRKPVLMYLKQNETYGALRWTLPKTSHQILKIWLILTFSQTEWIPIAANMTHYSISNETRQLNEAYLCIEEEFGTSCSRKIFLSKGLPIQPVMCINPNKTNYFLSLKEGNTDFGLEIKSSFIEVNPKSFQFVWLNKSKSNSNYIIRVEDKNSSACLEVVYVTQSDSHRDISSSLQDCKTIKIQQYSNKSELIRIKLHSGNPYSNNFSIKAIQLDEFECGYVIDLNIRNFKAWKIMKASSGNLRTSKIQEIITYSMLALLLVFIFVISLMIAMNHSKNSQSFPNQVSDYNCKLEKISNPLYGSGLYEICDSIEKNEYDLPDEDSEKYDQYSLYSKANSEI